MDRYSAYILQSGTTGKYYIGYSAIVHKRLKEHNRGRVRSTKAGIPWMLVYTEKYPSRQAAYRREMQIKRYKGGEAFYKLIEK